MVDPSILSLQLGITGVWSKRIVIMPSGHCLVDETPGSQAPSIINLIDAIPLSDQNGQAPYIVTREGLKPAVKATKVYDK